ncbi:MAG: N-acetylmuramoyl-L-alanine amidase [Anaerovoracaceae bacterium]
MKIKLKVILMFFIVMLLIVATPNYGDFVEISEQMRSQITMVIDPGHGGMDGGAEAADGTKEKNINLKIALKLKKEAEKYGVKVIMTRESDKGLYEEAGQSIHSKKIDDLKNRKEIIDKIKPDLTVSIHLNSYKNDELVRGAQVFFPKECQEESICQESKLLAETVQSTLEQSIDDKKERAAMAKNDIYLFKNVNTPIILVECGFLSNIDDEKSLINPRFQVEMAKAIMAGVAMHYRINIQRDTKVIDTKEQAQSL